MGHKAHPVGLRLGVHRKWKSNWFFDSKNYTNFLYTNFDVVTYFKSFFQYYPYKGFLIDCQIIKMTSNQIFIFIFFYKRRLKKKKFKNIFWRTKFWRINIKKTLILKKIEKLPQKYLQIKKEKNTFQSFLHATFNYNFILKYKYFIYKKNKNNENYFKILNNFILNVKIFKILLKIKKKKNFFYFILKFKIKLYQSFLKVISIFLINKIIPLFYLLYKTNISFLLKKICINYNNILINKYCFLIYKKNDFLNKQKYFINKSKINFNVSLKKKIKINIRSLLKFKYKISFYFKKINYFLLKRKYKLSKNFILKNIKKGLIKKHKIFFYKKYINLFYIKKKKLHLYKNKYIKKRHRLRALTKDVKYAMYTIKKFLTLLTNSKIYLILINSLSFCKFFYYTHKKILIKHYQNERFNLWPIQRYFFNRYKYTAIYIKDFIYLGFISTLTKNPQILVNMISKQFEFLPKNRRQFKLWNFITQTLGALCAKRLEIYGYKLSINGRLNKARRTQTYVFKKGALPLQSTRTRVEYAYSEGLTRKGLIGIKLWFLYHKWFKFKLRAKVLEYFLYSKYKNSFNFTIYKQNYKYLQKKKEIARIGHRKYYEKINAKTADEEIDEKIALFRSLSDKRNKMPFNKNKNVETKTT